MNELLEQIDFCEETLDYILFDELLAMELPPAELEAFNAMRERSEEDIEKMREYSELADEVEIRLGNREAAEEYAWDMTFGE
ncbi:MAG: hypothetical protein LBN30_00220 [Oscillospiraceae bacterium]|jgi:hypothetical protein|nr:hypothetical protein [Oscillospiraceae bacterium]